MEAHRWSQMVRPEAPKGLKKKKGKKKGKEREGGEAERQKEEERPEVGGIPRDSGKEKGKIGQNIREQKADMKTREWG